jgi:hypothetical protein
MQKRYFPFLVGMANLLAGGLLVLATFAWSSQTAVDIGFALSIALVAFGLSMTWLGYRATSGGEQIGVAVLGALTAAVAAWTIIATQVYAVGTAHWLVFASGLAHVGLAAASLMLHEISTERVVHQLEVSREREPIEAR